MRISTSLRWLVVAVSAAMLLAVVAACAGETVEVPGETVVVKEEVIKEVQVPGENRGGGEGGHQGGTGPR